MRRDAGRGRSAVASLKKEDRQVARLAYCKKCRATYPLSIVNGEGGRSTKPKVPACPMGHTEIEELAAPRKQRAKK